MDINEFLQTISGYPDALTAEQKYQLAFDELSQVMPAPLLEREFVTQTLSMLTKAPRAPKGGWLSRIDIANFANLLKLEGGVGITERSFRGEHGEETLQTKLGCWSFGTKEVATIYARSPNDHSDIASHPKIIEATLRIINPVMDDADDPFIDFTKIRDAIGEQKAVAIFNAMEELGVLSNQSAFPEMLEQLDMECATFQDVYDKKDELYFVFDEDGEPLPEKQKVTLDDLPLYADAYHIFDEPKFVEWFKEMGFDGLRQGGNGESAMTGELKVFYLDQVKDMTITDLPKPGVEPLISQPGLNTGSMLKVS